MVLGKSALAGVGGQHRGVDQFSQLHQFRARTSIKNTLAGMDHRAFGCQQQLGHGTHLSRIGAGAQWLDRSVIELALQLCFAYVAGQLQQHRPRLARAQLLKRAAHQFAHSARLIEFGGELGDVREIVHRGERRWGVAPARRLPRRQDQYRHVIGEELSYSGKGVFHPRSPLHRKYADTRAVGRAADAVGDPRAHPFLAADDRADSHFGAGVDQQLARITDQELNPLRLEYPCDRFGNFHFYSWAKLQLAARCPLSAWLLINQSQWLPAQRAALCAAGGEGMSGASCSLRQGLGGLPARIAASSRRKILRSSAIPASVRPSRSAPRSAIAPWPRSAT